MHNQIQLPDEYNELLLFRKVFIFAKKEKVFLRQEKNVNVDLTRKGIFYINHFSVLLSFFRFFATSNNLMMSLRKQQITYSECNVWKQLFADKFSHAFIENRSIALLFRNSLWIKNSLTLLYILTVIKPVCIQSTLSGFLRGMILIKNEILQITQWKNVLYMSSTYPSSNTLNTFVSICTIQMHDIRL